MISYYEMGKINKFVLFFDETKILDGDINSSIYKNKKKKKKEIENINEYTIFIIIIS